MTAPRVAFAIVLTFSAPSGAEQGEEELFFGPAEEADEAQEPAAPPPVAVVIEGLRPEAVISFTGEELQRRGYRTLGEALRDVVGVVRNNTTRGARYGMRGVPQGLALVIDGVPQVVEGQRDQLDVEGTLDLGDVERVEVVRGPVSALDGASALAGVVRVVTKRPGPTGITLRASGYHAGSEAIDGGKANGSASARFGDASFLVSGSLRSGPRQSWILKNAPRQFLRIGTATVPGTRSDETVVPQDERAATARVLASIYGFTFDLAYARSEERVPLSTLSHAILERPDERERDRVRARAGWRGDVWLARVDAVVAARWHHSDSRYALYPPGQAFPAGGAVEVSAGGVSAQAVLRADVPITTDHRLRFGVFSDVAQNSAHSDVVRPDDGALEPRVITLDDETATLSSAIEYQGDVGFGLHVTAGGVVRWQTGFPIVVLPRIGLTWAPVSSLSLRAAYAEGSRAPDRFDLVALTPAVFGGAVQQATAGVDLLAEQTRSLEIGVQFRPSAALRFDVGTYGTRHENALTTSVDDGVVMPTNLAARHVVGVEGRAELDPIPGLVTVFVAGWWSYTVDGLPLDQDVGSAVAGLALTPLEGLELGTRTFVQGRHFVTGLADPTTGSIDVYGSYGHSDWPVHLFVSATNVTDAWQPAPDPAGLPNAADVWSPAPGRRITFAVEGSL